MDTSADKLEIAKDMGADEALLSGDAAVKRIKDMTRGQGADLVLDMVGVNPTLKMAAQVARVLGHLTIVGLGGGALPVNFFTLPARMLRRVALLGLHPRAGGSGQPRPGGKDQDAGRALPAGARGRGLPAPARRQDQGTRGHHSERLTNTVGACVRQRQGRSGRFCMRYRGGERFDAPKPKTEKPLEAFEAESGCCWSSTERWRSRLAPAKRRRRSMGAGTVLVFLLQGAMFASVLVLGWNANPADVLYLWHRPGLLLRSFLAMYVVIPSFAVVLVLLLALPPGVEMGLVLVAISAGAPLLPKTMLKLGCNPPYVYSLLIITCLLAVITVPLSLALLSALSLEHDASVSPLQVALVVARTFLVPLAAGMLFRRLAPATFNRLRGPASLVAGLVLATVLLSLLVLNFPAVCEVGLPALGAIALLTFAGLAVGHLLGGPDPGNRTCLAVASANRHVGLAAVVAVANFPEARPLPVVLAFVVVSSLATIPYSIWRKKQLAAKAVEAPKSAVLAKAGLGGAP